MSLHVCVHVCVHLHVHVHVETDIMVSWCMNAPISCSHMHTHIICKHLNEFDSAAYLEPGISQM